MIFFSCQRYLQIIIFPPTLLPKTPSKRKNSFPTPLKKEELFSLNFLKRNTVLHKPLWGRKTISPNPLKKETLFSIKPFWGETLFSTKSFEKEKLFYLNHLKKKLLLSSQNETFMLTLPTIYGIIYSHSPNTIL